MTFFLKFSSKQGGEPHAWRGHTCQSEAWEKIRNSSTTHTDNSEAPLNQNQQHWQCCVRLFSKLHSVGQFICRGTCEKFCNQDWTKHLLALWMVFIGLFYLVYLLNPNIMGCHTKETIHTRTINSSFSDLQIWSKLNEKSMSEQKEKSHIDKDKVLL